MSHIDFRVAFEIANTMIPFMMFAIAGELTLILLVKDKNTK